MTNKFQVGGWYRHKDGTQVEILELLPNNDLFCRVIFGDERLNAEITQLVFMASLLTEEEYAMKVLES